MTTRTDTLVIDTDTHVSEPPDLWTSRVSKQWRDLAPRVIVDDEGVERWLVGTTKLDGAAKWAAAGWSEYPPSWPPTLAEADPGAWDPAARLRRMDEYGVFAQVLYPNILAFYMPTLLGLGEPEFVLELVRAYNDFLVEFASEDPRRLIPVMVVPFWDVEETVKEMRRSAAKGHRGVVFASSFDKIGLPPIWDEHWAPVLAEAQRLGLSIDFHVGFVSLTEEELSRQIHAVPNDHVRSTSVTLLGNARAIADITTMGVCHRYPELNFVSVESGVGWMPYVMDSLDWHWKSFGAREEYPDMELPSFYVRRQVYGSFWFEPDVRAAAEALPDNVMFQTDYPHPTSISPGPKSAAESPRLMAERAVAGLSDDIARKVLFENAARLFRL